MGWICAPTIYLHRDGYSCCMSMARMRLSPRHLPGCSPSSQPERSPTASHTTRKSLATDRALAAQAILHANVGNRNDTGFWLACQLRDAGLPSTAAENVPFPENVRSPAGKVIPGGNGSPACVLPIRKPPARPFPATIKLACFAIHITDHTAGGFPPEEADRMIAHCRWPVMSPIYLPRPGCR